MFNLGDCIYALQESYSKYNELIKLMENKNVIQRTKRPNL